MPGPMGSPMRVFRSISRARWRIAHAISTAKDGVVQELRDQLLRSRFERNRTGYQLPFNWNDTNYNRTAVINLVLATKPEARYLEIGCADNKTFDSVIAAQKVGVDPRKGGTHRMTSDEFFRTWTGGDFDVIFIDGLHVYEQAARDLRNSFKLLNDGGWVVLHDMLPSNWLEEHVPRISDPWTGDVWKVGFELAQTKDVDFKIVEIDFGVGVVQPRIPNPEVPDLANELRDMRFSYLYENIHRLPLIGYDEGRTWLRSRVNAVAVS
jgi:hypothetical protein